MSLKIHLKRREKSVKKTVLKKGARLFYFIHPRKSKKVLCVSKSPLLREGMPKRERKRERERNIENRIETEMFASSAAKVELFGGMLFLFYDYYLEAKRERGVRLLLDNFIRIKNTHFAPRERTHLITTTT